MFRVIATIAASLVLSPLQAAAPADTAGADRLAGGALVSSALQAQIEGLQEALQRYRDLAAAGGWPAVPAGPTIRPDSDDSRLGILATRLVVG